MKIELGEFTEGLAKGFRYYYPSVESIDEAKKLFETDSHFLAFLNTRIKQAYSEKVRTTRLPKQATREQLEVIAKDKPDGVLFSIADVHNFKPWQKTSSWEQDLGKLMSEYTSKKISQEHFLAQLDALNKKKLLTTVE